MTRPKPRTNAVEDSNLPRLRSGRSNRFQTPPSNLSAGEVISQDHRFPGSRISRHCSSTMLQTVGSCSSQPLFHAATSWCQAMKRKFQPTYPSCSLPQRICGIEARPTTQPVKVKSSPHPVVIEVARMNVARLLLKR